MATDSTEDDLLQTFLADVERLSISSADERMGNEGKQDAIDSDRSEAGDGAWQPNPTIVAGVERSGKHPPSSGAAAAAAASESASDRSKKGGMKGMMMQTPTPIEGRGRNSTRYIISRPAMVAATVASRARRRR